jgi:hypothetical protein
MQCALLRMLVPAVQLQSRTKNMQSGSPEDTSAGLFVRILKSLQRRRTLDLPNSNVFFLGRQHCRSIGIGRGQD